MCRGADVFAALMTEARNFDYSRLICNYETSIELYGSLRQSPSSQYSMISAQHSSQSVVNFFQLTIVHKVSLTLSAQHSSQGLVNFFSST